MIVEETRKLFSSDLKEAETALNEFLDANEIKLKQNQFDALISFAHQYGKDWWTVEPEKFYPDLYVRVMEIMTRKRCVKYLQNMIIRNEEQ